MLNIIGEIMKRQLLQCALSHTWRKDGASVLLLVQCSVPGEKIPLGRARMRWEYQVKSGVEKLKPIGITYWRQTGQSGRKYVCCNAKP